MLPFYQVLSDQFKWEADVNLVETLKAANDEELKVIDDKIKDAEENLGESEIREALLARAEFFSYKGDKVTFPFFHSSVSPSLPLTSSALFCPPCSSLCLSSLSHTHSI